MGVPFVSVIIPVFNGWAQLEDCIGALERQSYPSEHFEIIVVNNKPEIGPDHRLPSSQNARMIHEPNPGSYSARNTGLGAAKGDILAFTDSDCLPDQDWIRNAIDIFLKKPEIARIGGRIELSFSDPDKPTVVELYEKVFAFQQEAKVKEEGSAITANMFSRAAVFATTGPFNGDLRSGGDLEWGRWANKAGFPIAYARDVCVVHPARSTWSAMARKVARLRGGRWQLRKYRNSQTEFAAEPGDRSPSRVHFAGMLLVLTTPQLNSLSQRIKVATVVIFVYLVKILEQIRLLLGGAPRRD